MEFQLRLPVSCHLLPPLPQVLKSRAPFRLLWLPAALRPSPLSDVVFLRARRLTLSPIFGLVSSCQPVLQERAQTDVCAMAEHRRAALADAFNAKTPVTQATCCRQRRQTGTHDFLSGSSVPSLSRLQAARTPMAIEEPCLTEVHTALRA